MQSILFQAYEDVTCEKVRGSDRTVEKGVGWTVGNPGTCNPGWFVGETTTILGAENPEYGSTIARWQLLMDPAVVGKCESGHLVISCERTHGGLHTRRWGAAARVSLNGHNRDLIGLKDIAAGHADFFHRLPDPPKLPPVWPVSGCATVYSWPVDKRHLVTSGSQVVEIELDKDVAWDIDYVCLIISRTSYQLREAWKQIGYVLIGVVLGAIATIVVGG